jgi:hypothetical protein
MSQMLSTFSTIEQSRFEAFRRVVFPANAIENWIACCLQYRYDTAVINATSTTLFSHSNNNNNNNNTSTAPTPPPAATFLRNNPFYNNMILTVTSKQQQNQHKKHTTIHPLQSSGSKSLLSSSSSRSSFVYNKRPLSDLVAPGNHTDIGLIVSVAAKIYAQRLVKAALLYQKKEFELQHQQQQQEEQDQQQNQPTNSQLPLQNQNNNNQHQHQQPLSVMSVWKTVQDRQQRGIDPGFFLQGTIDNNNILSINNISATACGQESYNQQKRIATLAIQDEYDQQLLLLVQQQKQLSQEIVVQDNDQHDNGNNSSEDDDDDDSIDFEMEDEGEVSLNNVSKQEEKLETVSVPTDNEGNDNDKAIIIGKDNIDVTSSSNSSSSHVMDKKKNDQDMEI